MSACSSTRGSSVLVEEAQLGAEQPDALDGPGAAARRRRAVGDVGQQLDGGAVGGRRRAGPRRRARARSSRLACDPLGRRRRRRGRARPRRWRRRPARGCRRRCRGARDADHARDAELAGDDRGVAGRPARSVTRATHDGRVETGGVGGRQVLGDQHRRLVGRRHAGLGLADDVGDHAGARCRCRSVTRSAIRPPMLVNSADELLDGRPQRAAAGRLRRVEPLRDRLAQPLVAGQAGARDEHLGGRAGGLGGRAQRAVGDRAATASSYAASAASASASSPASKRATATGETSPRTTRTGPWATPGTTGVPLAAARVAEGSVTSVASWTQSNRRHPLTVNTIRA